MSDRLDQAASAYDEVADELERAVEHARTAARHFRDGEIPRGAAHAWAVRGHVLEAERHLDEQAREHARRSNP